MSFLIFWDASRFFKVNWSSGRMFSCRLNFLIKWCEALFSSFALCASLREKFKVMTSSVVFQSFLKNQCGVEFNLSLPFAFQCINLRSYGVWCTSKSPYQNKNLIFLKLIISKN